MSNEQAEFRLLLRNEKKFVSNKMKQGDIQEIFARKVRRWFCDELFSVTNISTL